MSLTVMGNKTQSIFLKGPEAHKLHHEFTVADTVVIKKGQPVVLNADGEVKPADAAADASQVIGYSIHNGGEGDLVTVAMKAFIIVWAMPNAALDGGPVKYEGMNSTDENFNSFTAVAGTEEGSTIGWALDQSTAADQMIRVALT